MSSIVSQSSSWTLPEILLLLFSLVFIMHWVAFIWGIGRYSPAKKNTQNSSAGYLIATLFAKVITNFRHLLALIIVSIFGIAVLYTMIDGYRFDENLQTVVAALGGIVGSVLGYYFGEAKLKASEGDGEDVDPINGLDQDDPPDDPDPGLRMRPAPPAKARSDAPEPAPAPENDGDA